MSNAKKSVIDMIARKEKRIKELRKAYVQHIGPEKLVADFMKTIDEKRCRCVNSMDFDDLITREARNLDNRLKHIDVGVSIRIIYNDEEMVEDWRKLQIEAVHVTWSEDWRAKNPSKEGELFIDMGTLFLEGLL
jgi:hypothetical protein